MANWVTVASTKETINWNKLTNNAWGGTVYLTLQYDSESVTTTSVKVRWELSCSNNSWNYYYLLANPRNGKSDKNWGTLIPLKTKWTENTKGGYPYYGPVDGYTLYKDADADSFSLPTLWFCNDGYNVSSPDTAEEFYKCYSTEDDDYKKYTNDRPNGLTYVVNMATVSAVPGVVTTIKPGSVEIVDNYDNTFNINVTHGQDGLNNARTSTTLKLAQRQIGSSWQFDDTINVSHNVNSFSRNNIALSANAPNSTSNGKKLVCAELSVYGPYNTDGVKSYGNGQSGGVEICHFVKPTKPGKVTLSYAKNRLTVKEPWEVSWVAATKANDVSPIKGYEIVIHQNGTTVTGLVVDSNNIITKGTGTNTAVLIENTDCVFTLDPVDIGFSAHDTIDFIITAYTRNGRHNDGAIIKGTSKSAAEDLTGDGYEIQNAGIVRVARYNANNQLEFVEGQVKVYRTVNGVPGWQEAETVKVWKKDAQNNYRWLESQ